MKWIRFINFPLHSTSVCVNFGRYRLRSVRHGRERQGNFHILERLTSGLKALRYVLPGALRLERISGMTLVARLF